MPRIPIFAVEILIRSKEFLVLAPFSKDELPLFLLQIGSDLPGGKQLATRQQGGVVTSGHEGTAGK